MDQEHNIVSLSGGKDSTATLLCAIEDDPENLDVVFCDTGHEHPITYEYLEYLEKALSITIIKTSASFHKQIEKKRLFVQTKWAEKGVHEEIIRQALEVLHPTGNPFLDLCLWKGRFPSSQGQFCTQELKINPFINHIQAHLQNNDSVISWQGIRREESKRRENLPKIDDQGGGYLIYRPIISWTVDQVFQQHKKHNIQPNPLYKMGMGRVGCMPCINSRKDEIYHISKQFPEVIDKIRHWEFLVGQASKRGAATFFASESNDPTSKQWTPQQWFDNGNIDKVVDWSMTTRGGKDFDIFKSNDTPMSGCRSIYGLCE